MTESISITEYFETPEDQREDFIADLCRNISLPKWPMCFIEGKSITREQALEIILRTDYFLNGFISGNDDIWKEAVRKAVLLPTDYRYENEWGDDSDLDWDAKEKQQEDWKKAWGYEELYYLDNHWISSSYIGGPYGWCHPTGEIWHTHNIGKWPHCEEVINELAKIGRAFPFIEMTLTLYNGEEPDPAVDDFPTPVVRYQLKDGVITKLPTPTKEESLNAWLPYSRREGNYFTNFPPRETYTDEIYNKKYWLAAIKKWRKEHLGK